MVTKERALADWGMKEGDGAWNLSIHEGKVETVASYNMCTKCLKITTDELITTGTIKTSKDLKGFSFLGKVKGTGPDFEDAFRCYVDLLD